MRVEAIDHKSWLRPDDVVKIYLVPPSCLSMFWEDVLPWLERGREYWQDYYSAQDLYVEIFSGRVHLWLTGEGPGPFGCILTEIRQYPKTRVLRFLYAGGENDNINKLMPGGALHDFILRWAWMAHRVGFSEICGRRGWERVVSGEGYEFLGTFLRKRVTAQWEN